MPHPSEAKINIRIQTKPGSSSLEAFRSGLKDLISVAQHINETFNAAVAAGPVGVRELPPPSHDVAVEAAPTEAKKSRKGARADSKSEEVATKKR